MSEVNVTHVAQIRHARGKSKGVWSDERWLPDGGVNGKMKMEELRKDPELAGYEIRAVRRTEEVLDI